MNIYTMVKPLGLLTYLVVLLALVTGLKRARLSLHMTLALSAISLATIHGALVIYLNFFAR